MSEEIKLVRIQFRRDTANNWKGVNPVLADGEMGVESDTNKFKFGNGTSTWNELGYANSEAGNIPTKLSELENDTGFITLSDVETAGFIKQDALTDYALKSELPTDETVAEWGYTKNEGTVKSVNNVEPDENGNVTISAGEGNVKTVNNIEPDAEGNVEITIPSKTSELDNDSDFLARTEASETFATKQEIALIPGDYIDITEENGGRKISVDTINGIETDSVTAYTLFEGNSTTNTGPASVTSAPFVILNGQALTEQKLYSISFTTNDVNATEYFTLANLDTPTSLNGSTTFVDLFNIKPSKTGYDTYLLDGTDSRVTINQTYVQDGYVVIPKGMYFSVGKKNQSSSGLMYNTDKTIGQNFCWIKDNALSLSEASFCFNIKAVTSCKKKEVLKTESVEKVTYTQNIARCLITTNTSVLYPTAATTNGPYVFTDNKDLQDVYLDKIGFVVTSLPCPPVNFFIGEGETVDTLDYSKTPKLVFTINPTVIGYSEYILDGTDPNVTLNTENLINNRVYIGPKQVLTFLDNVGDVPIGFITSKDAPKYTVSNQCFAVTRNWTSVTKYTSSFNFQITTTKADKILIEEEVTNNPLAGKVVSLIGDSISTYSGYLPSGYATYYPKGDVQSVDDTWWMKIIKKGHMVLGQNCAWSGSKVTGDGTSTSSAAAGCSTARINDLAKNGTPDIVIVYIGTNDLRNGTAMGAWTKGEAIPTDSSDVATMAEAYALMVYKVMNTYKNAHVFCCSIPEAKRVNGQPITTYPLVTSADLTFYDLNDKIKEVCDALGATYIDLHGCGITWWNIEQYTVYESTGALHPNCAGMDLFANCIYSAISNFYQPDKE